MAQFTEVRTPYEFLVRWDEEGNIKGAHVGWLDTVKKDGEILSQKSSNVESVSIGTENGFPLDQLLNSLQLDALKEIDKLREDLFRKDVEIQQLNSKISKLTE